MKSAKQLLEERQRRVTQAITLGTPDRVPIMPAIDAWAATYRGGSMAKLSSSILYSNKLILETCRDFPDIDMIEFGAALPRAVAAATLSTVKLAGKELPEGSLWQVVELEHVRDEDYDLILKKGWNAWKKDYYKQVLGWGKYDTFKLILGGIIAGNRCKKAGMPLFSGVFTNIPIDPLAGGRGMAKFMTDLHRMPDKMQAVFDVMIDDIINETKGIIKQAKPYSAFLGVARGACDVLGPKQWNRFVWPYIVKIVNALADTGTFVNLHFDSSWDREIDRFLELPKGRCVWACDHATDIFKLKAKLGDHMCIKGDIPATMMVLGTPDDVYNYSTNLLREMGPKGFIMAPACTTPYNTKPENFKAMISAVTGR